MTSARSIAAARDQLPALIREAEEGGVITLTRRGAPVAVLLSVQEYARLTRPQGGFSERLAAFRQQHPVEELALDDAFDGLRDRSPGRSSPWE